MIQQRFVALDISLAEKIVERHVTQAQQVADIPVVALRQILQLQFVDQVVDVPVVVVAQVPQVHVVMKTAEIPQLQVDDKVVDVPVVLVVPVSQVRVVKKTVEDHSFRSWRKPLRSQSC